MRELYGLPLVAPGAGVDPYLDLAQRLVLLYGLQGVTGAWNVREEMDEDGVHWGVSGESHRVHDLIGDASKLVDIRRMQKALHLMGTADEPELRIAGARLFAALVGQARANQLAQDTRSFPLWGYDTDDPVRHVYQTAARLEALLNAVLPQAPFSSFTTEDCAVRSLSGVDWSAAHGSGPLAILQVEKAEVLPWSNEARVRVTGSIVRALQPTAFKKLSMLSTLEPFVVPIIPVHAEWASVLWEN